MWLFVHVSGLKCWISVFQEQRDFGLDWMSGRKKIGGLKMPVTLGPGDAERIDELIGPRRRGEFIRDAVREKLSRCSALSGAVNNLSPVPASGKRAAVSPSLSSDRWGSDKAVLRAWLEGNGAATVRVIGSDLGWPVMRVERVLRLLVDEGLVFWSAAGVAEVV